MECIPYHPGLLAGVNELVNEYIRQMPPYWTFNNAQMSRILSEPFFWRVHYPEEKAPDQREIWCVVEGQNVLAAGQFEYASDVDPITQKHASDFNWCFGRPQASQAFDCLLETLVSQAQKAGIHELSMGRNPFGLGWSGIPETWMHLGWGLEKQDFKRASNWIVMLGGTDARWEGGPAAPENVSFEWIVDLEASEWDVCTLINYTIVGECSAWRIPPYFDGCPGSTRWTTLEWIGVESPYLGQGNRFPPAGGTTARSEENRGGLCDDLGRNGQPGGTGFLPTLWI